MFEDISDPSRNAPPRTFMGNSLTYVPPTDSFEASWNARLCSAFAFVLVAIDLAGRFGAFGSLLFLRDLVVLALLGLVWVFRSRAAAVLASALAPLFWFGQTDRGPGHYPDAYDGHRDAVVILAFCLFAAWACHRFHQFRREESALPPDSPDGVRPA